MKDIKEIRQSLAHRYATKLVHGEHLTHMFYLGAVAFAEHHFVAIIACVGLVFVIAEFIIGGFNGEA